MSPQAVAAYLLPWRDYENIERMAMDTINCTKISGTGNSFLFFDARTKKASKELADFFKGKTRATVARELCDPQHGVGADGIVFVESVPNSLRTAQRVALRWDFYNADGSVAEMCGNASRCMALYARSLNIAFNPLPFLTRAGLIKAEILKINANETEAFVQVEMTSLKGLKLGLNVKDGRENLPYSFVNTGVPHAVFEVKSKIKFNPKRGSAAFEKLDHIHRLIESQSSFKKDGTNVTFFWRLKGDRIQSLTFERGVDGFTQACGTGAVAAAYIALQTENSKNRFPLTVQGRSIALEVPGGRLGVGFGVARPLLIGPAKVIAQITLSR